MGSRSDGVRHARIRGAGSRWLLSGIHRTGLTAWCSWRAAARLAADAVRSPGCSYTFRSVAVSPATLSMAMAIEKSSDSNKRRHGGTDPTSTWAGTLDGLVLKIP